MTKKQLRAFLAVADTLNFAVAAERIPMSQPALSIAIKTLEDTLGGKLLIRTTRRVRLTPEGEVLVGKARHILADWDDAEEVLKHQFALRRGHITMAAMPSFASNLLPSLMTEYKALYPHVDIAINDVVHEEVLSSVASGRVELGIGFEPDSTHRTQFVPLFKDRFVAIVTNDTALAAARAVTWKQLLKHQFITLQRPSTVRDLLERSLSAEGIELQVAMDCHQLATVGAMVAAGLGVSVVPSLCGAQMKLLGARTLELRGPVVERRVGLIVRRTDELSTAARAMYDVALRLFRY